jgi:hypothetical protein
MGTLPQLPRGGGVFRNENVNRPISIERPAEAEKREGAQPVDTSMKGARKIPYTDYQAPPPKPLSWK